MSEHTPPIDLDFFQDARIAGLLGAVVALSGVLLVLKAEVKRLRATLEADRVLDPQRLETVGDQPDIQGWIAREAQAQARAVLAPILNPDAVRDVRGLMPESAS